MTPEDRARVVVKQFQEDGHPYYDELVEMIAAAISEQREQTKAWEATARKLATALEHLTPSLKSDSRLQQVNKARGRAVLSDFNLMATHHSTLLSSTLFVPPADQEPQP